MNKKLKLTKLTISNLERVKGGDPVCLCPLFPDGSPDEAFYHGGFQTILSCRVCVP